VVGVEKITREGYRKRDNNANHDRYYFKDFLGALIALKELKKDLSGLLLLLFEAGVLFLCRSRVVIALKAQEGFLSNMQASGVAG